MKKSYIADLVLLFVTFVWGATFVLVKEAINTMPPFTFLATRFLFAAVILALFMLIFYRDQLKSMGKDVWLIGSWVGLWLSVGYAFQTFGLQYTTASKAGFITGLAVVLVPLLSLWLLRHRLKPNAILGVVMAAVGLGMLSLNRQLNVEFGDFLVFLCAICFAMHITLIGRFTVRFHALPFALVQIIAVGVLNAIGAVLFEDYQVAFSPTVLLDAWVLSALLICSLIATAFAFVAQNQFQKFTTPTRTALIFSTEPVFAAITGYFWANDRLAVMQVAGCLLILAGMIVAELGGNSEEASGEAETSTA